MGGLQPSLGRVQMSFNVQSFENPSIADAKQDKQKFIHVTLLTQVTSRMKTKCNLIDIDP